MAVLRVLLAVSTILLGATGCASAQSSAAGRAGEAVDSPRASVGEDAARDALRLEDDPEEQEPHPSKEGAIAFLVAKRKAHDAREAFIAYRSALGGAPREPGTSVAQHKARFDSLFEEAADAFDKAVGLDKRSAVVRREYAEFLHDFVRWEEKAISLLERAVELDPGHFATVMHLGQHYDSRGKADRAVSMYKLAVKARPGVVKGRSVAAVRSRLAQLYEKTGNARQALDEYESLLRDYATGALPGATAQMIVDREADTICDKLSGLYPATGQTQRGIDFLEWFLGRTEVDQASLALGRLCAQAEQYERAMAVARDYADKNPLEGGGHSLIVEIYRKQGLTDEAIAYCQGILERRPQSNLAMRLLAGLYGETGRIDEAAQLYEKIIKRHPKILFFYLEFARFCRKHGLRERELGLLGHALDNQLDPDKVTREIDDLLKDNEDLSQAADRIASDDDIAKGFGMWCLLGEVYHRADRSDDAESAFRKSFELSPSFPLTVIRLGEICRDGDRPEEGLDIMRRARASGLVHPLIFNMTGMFYSMMEDYERHAQTLSQGVTLFPEDRNLRYNLAIAYELAGDSKRGEEELQRLLASQPDDPIAANALGYLYAEQGRNLDEAERLIRIALEDEPKNGAYIDSLAWVYFKRGKLQTARKFLEEAIEYEKSDPEILDHLGDVYFRLGLHDMARDAWQRALEGERKTRKITERVRGKLKELESILPDDEQGRSD